MRAEQWYKNLVVFLALFFSGNLFNTIAWPKALQAFLSLCLLSSAGYIINDIVDASKDAVHPLKKYRPLAAGTVPTFPAGMLSLLLLLSSALLAWPLGISFRWLILGMFALALLYTFILKNILIADVLTIASLFVLRAVAGALAIEVRISPWLILCPFFVALFLALAKRYHDLQLLQEKASSTRSVLEHYTPEFTLSLMIISISLLTLSYALYTFLSEHNLIYTLPFALFVFLRGYFWSIKENNWPKIWKDTPLLIGIILWMVVTGMIVYW